jgi:hypothetical protein
VKERLLKVKAKMYNIKGKSKALIKGTVARDF